MIPLYKIYSDDADVDAVTEVIRRGRYWAEGPSIEEFERQLALYLNIPGVLACNSGTSALHMAVLACGVRHFHEVIVPSFTFIATVNAVRFVRAKPIFADIEESTCGLSPEDVERKITPKTKAIIAVHYGGLPCRILELRQIAKRHNLMLIEDAAEALGARVNDIPVGTFSDCGILSFCANKIISTGEGGALVTGNKFYYDRASLMRSHGREAGSVNNGSPETYSSLGYNFRMSDMTAALGISQLAKIGRLIAMRRDVARQYAEQLKSLPDIIYPHDDSSVYQLYTIRILGGKRDKVKTYLAQNGIGCKVYFKPVHLTKYYQRESWLKDTVHLPITEQIAGEALSLPMYPGLTSDGINYICSKVKEALTSA